MSVKMNVEVELIEFRVPESIYVVNNSDNKMLLSELNWETLNKLCDNFRAGVFKNANIKDSKGK